MEETKTSKNIWRKTGRIILRSVIFLVLFFLLLAGLILLPPVQRFISQKAVAYLEKKLGTKVALGKLYTTRFYNLLKKKLAPDAAVVILCALLD